MGKTFRNRYFRELRHGVYEQGKKKHPHGCAGMWAWIPRTLKVSCQGCGYTMGIKTQTKELEHLPIGEATKRCLKIVEYGRPDYEG